MRIVSKVLIGVLIATIVACAPAAPAASPARPAVKVDSTPVPHPKNIQLLDTKDEVSFYRATDYSDDGVYRKVCYIVVLRRETTSNMEFSCP